MRIFQWRHNQVRLVQDWNFCFSFYEDKHWPVLHFSNGLSQSVFSVMDNKIYKVFLMKNWSSSGQQVFLIIIYPSARKMSKAKLQYVHFRSRIDKRNKDKLIDHGLKYLMICGPRTEVNLRSASYELRPGGRFDTLFLHRVTIFKIDLKYSTIILLSTTRKK